MARTSRQHRIEPGRPAATVHPPTFDVDAALANAIQHHKSDRLRDAEALYRRILKLRPEHPDALHLLGVVATSAGHAEDAVGLIKPAIAANPNTPAYHLSLAKALRRSGRSTEAIAVCRRAVDAFPEVAEIRYRLGASLRSAGDAAEAARVLGGAIEIGPNLFQAHFELGDALKDLGRYQAAEAAYRHAAEIKPDNPNIHSNLAALYLEWGNPEKALPACDACLKAEPANRRALAFKAVALNELGRRQAAGFLLDFERLIYAAPIEVPASFADLAAFNAALASHIAAHPTLHVGQRDHSTRLGRHTENLLAEPPAGPLRVFVEVIVRAVEAYMDWLPADPAHPYLATRPTDWRMVMWGNILQAQGYQAPHIHPDGWVSGVYYVELHDDTDTPGHRQDGWIEFGQPISEFVTKVPPILQRMRPEVGQAILFPSYFYHRTLPFDSAGRRISLAFDFVPAG